MTAAEVRKYFRRAIVFWRPIVGLSHWQLFVQEGADQDEPATATCYARPEYEEAVIQFDPTAILRDKAYYKTAEHISYLALHELCHCHTWVLLAGLENKQPEKTARWHCERNTTMVARAVWVARYHRPPPE